MKKSLNLSVLCLSLILTVLQFGSSELNADSVSATIAAGEIDITINSAGTFAYAPTGPASIKVVNIATNEVSNIQLSFGAVQHSQLDTPSYASWFPNPEVGRHILNTNGVLPPSVVVVAYMFFSFDDIVSS